jgi:hypothetical protein
VTLVERCNASAYKKIQYFKRKVWGQDFVASRLLLQAWESESVSFSCYESDTIRPTPDFLGMDRYEWNILRAQNPGFKGMQTGL